MLEPVHCCSVVVFVLLYCHFARQLVGILSLGVITFSRSYVRSNWLRDVLMYVYAGLMLYCYSQYCVVCGCACVW